MPRSARARYTYCTLYVFRRHNSDALRQRRLQCVHRDLHTSDLCANFTLESTAVAPPSQSPAGARGDKHVQTAAGCVRITTRATAAHANDAAQCSGMLANDAAPSQCSGMLAKMASTSWLCSSFSRRCVVDTITALPCTACTPPHEHVRKSRHHQSMDGGGQRRHVRCCRMQAG